jgi:hypothetical protein
MKTSQASAVAAATGMIVAETHFMTVILAALGSLKTEKKLVTKCVLTAGRSMTPMMTIGLATMPQDPTDIRKTVLIPCDAVPKKSTTLATNGRKTPAYISVTGATLLIHNAGRMKNSGK